MLRFSSVLTTGALALAILAPNTVAPLQAATVALAAYSDEDEKILFTPSADIMADVTATLEAAKAEGKLGLIVMGANWCHDSRALITKFDDPALAAVLEKNYSTILVDVGELEHGKNVIQRFGMPVIYGTPTVLIVDPATEKQLNRHNMHQWRNAYSISQEDTTAYFENMVKAETRNTPEADPDSVALRAVLAKIDSFEQDHAERVYKAFALIGPMITMKRSERPDNFGDLWNELRDFRYQVTEDLKALRDDARSQAKTGETKINVNFPDYTPFSWEASANASGGENN